MAEAIRSRAWSFDSKPDARAVESWLLSIFLALGPVSWLPGIPQGVLRWLTMALFFVIVALVLAPPLRRDDLQLPKGVLGIWGFVALLALSVPGLAQTGQSFAAINYLGDILRNALFLWCFYHLARRGADIALILRRTFYILGVLAGLALGKVLIDLANPLDFCFRLWDQPSVAGFAAKRSQWAIGIGIVIPVALLFAGSRLAMKGRMALWYAMVALLAAQGFSGGRTGILMSAVAVLALLLHAGTRWLAKWLLAGSAIVFALVLASPTCLHHFKLMPLAQVGGTAETIAPQGMTWQPSVGGRRAQSVLLVANELSTSRLEIWQRGFQRMIERPLLGHGIREVLFPGRWTKHIEVHNLYLKWALYCGLLAPLFFLAMVFAVARRAWQLFPRAAEVTGATQKLVGALGLIVLLGLACSMFEPNPLVGSFHLTAIWWAAAGALAGLHSRLGAGTLAAATRP